MRVRMDDYDLARSSGRTRLFIARPEEEGRWPGLAFYSDIFQLGESTRRMAIRFASYGFVVAASELYWRLEPPGTVFAFDDAGRERGMECARATTLADFDDDIAAVRQHLLARTDVEPNALGAVGFCLGGHLAFRAAFAPEVGATACFYPTGLHDGALGAGVADSLARAREIRGALSLVFGDRDPHTTAAERDRIVADVAAAGVDVRVASFDAEHAFMRDVGPRYDAQASDAAFASAIALFRATLAPEQHRAFAP